jgi:hypothetical protein
MKGYEYPGPAVEHRKKLSTRGTTGLDSKRSNASLRSKCLTTFIGVNAFW